MVLAAAALELASRMKGALARNGPADIPDILDSERYSIINDRRILGVAPGSNTSLFGAGRPRGTLVIL